MFSFWTLLVPTSIECSKALDCPTESDSTVSCGGAEWLLSTGDDELSTGDDELGSLWPSGSLRLYTIKHYYYQSVPSI